MHIFQIDLNVLISLQVQRREITLQQAEHDLDMVKDKYKDAVEENGRLEARIQAFAINAQSEQDVLNIEVNTCLVMGIWTTDKCFPTF